MLAEVALLVSGFQDAAVLHNHGHPSREVERQQEALHGGGENFSGAHFAPEFHEVLFFVQVIQTAHDR